MKMKRIIPPIDKELLKRELTKDKHLRTTNYGKKEIYSVNYHDSPNVVKEIGRLRELTFRNAGGGTGKDADIDNYDISNNPYQQLIVWDPKRKEILGGYRYILCYNAEKGDDCKYDLATRNLFNFSEKFIDDFLPYTIELGRSFVQPNYQSGVASREQIFTLDNLWDGLGALMVLHPNIRYFFGKVTMYPDFNKKARDMILYFLEKQFPDPDKLIYPISPLQINTDRKELEKIFIGKDYREDYKILSQNVRALGVNIPPLINSYMNLSPTMRTFGTALNTSFGHVEETGIMITIEDIYENKKERHIKFNRDSLMSAWKRFTRGKST